MARFGVRSGSVAFARLDEKPCKHRIDRTGANRSERPLALAMQKVVGSSPIIRFNKAPLDGVLCCLGRNRDRRHNVASAHSCPINRPVTRSQVRPGQAQPVQHDYRSYRMRQLIEAHEKGERPSPYTVNV
jgi:hypothetical protein